MVRKSVCGASSSMFRNQTADTRLSFCSTLRYILEQDSQAPGWASPPSAGPWTSHEVKNHTWITRPTESPNGKDWQTSSDRMQITDMHTAASVAVFYLYNVCICFFTADILTCYTKGKHVLHTSTKVQIHKCHDSVKTQSHQAFTGVKKYTVISRL